MKLTKLEEWKDDRNSVLFNINLRKFPTKYYFVGTKKNNYHCRFSIKSDQRLYDLRK